MNERKKEIGLFRSVGFRQKNILQIILLEAFILSAIAGVSGFLIGFMISQNAAPLVGVQTLVVPFDLTVFGLAGVPLLFQVCLKNHRNLRPELFLHLPA